MSAPPAPSVRACPVIFGEQCVKTNCALGKPPGPWNPALGPVALSPPINRASQGHAWPSRSPFNRSRTLPTPGRQNMSATTFRLQAAQMPLLANCLPSCSCSPAGSGDILLAWPGPLDSGHCMLPTELTTVETLPVERLACRADWDFPHPFRSPLCRERPPPCSVSDIIHLRLDDGRFLWSGQRLDHLPAEVELKLPEPKIGPCPLSGEEKVERVAALTLTERPSCFRWGARIRAFPSAAIALRRIRMLLESGFKAEPRRASHSGRPWKRVLAIPGPGCHLPRNSSLTPASRRRSRARD